MRSSKIGWCGLAMTGLLLAGGCGGGGSKGAPAASPTTPTTPTTNAAETQLGAASLSPDSGIAAATALTAEDFSPEDTRNQATLGSENLAPQ